MLNKQQKNLEVSNEWFFGNSDKVIYNNAGMSSSVFDKLDLLGKINVAFKALSNVLDKKDYETAKVIKRRIYELPSKEATFLVENPRRDDILNALWTGRWANRIHTLFERGKPAEFGKNVKPFKEFKTLQAAVLQGEYEWLIDYANNVYKSFTEEMNKVLDNPKADQINKVYGNYHSQIQILNFIFDGYSYHIAMVMEGFRDSKFDFTLPEIWADDFVVGVIKEFIFNPKYYLTLTE